MKNREKGEIILNDKGLFQLGQAKQRLRRAPLSHTPTRPAKWRLNSLEITDDYCSNGQS